MTTKCIGIWMDHTKAHLMELTSGEMTTKTIESKFTAEERRDNFHTSEKAVHNREQREEFAYYQEIAESIKPYQEVLLFGPTDAKTELFNILKADHHFDKIHIETKPGDKMTENQQYAFVKEHFSKQLSSIK